MMSTSTKISQRTLLYSLFCGDLVSAWFDFVDNPCVVQLTNRATRKHFLVRHTQMVTERPVLINCSLAICPHTRAFPPRLSTTHGYPRCFPLRVGIAPDRFSVPHTVRLARKNNQDTFETVVDYLQSCYAQLVTKEEAKPNEPFTDQYSTPYLEENIVAVFRFPDEDVPVQQRWIDALVCFNEIALDRSLHAELRHLNGRFVLYYTRFKKHQYQFHLSFIELGTENEMCVISMDCNAAQRYSFLTFLLSFVRPASFELWVNSHFAIDNPFTTEAKQLVYQYTFVLQDQAPICEYVLQQEKQNALPFKCEEWVLFQDD
jgi:hypothetical protein